MNNLEEFVTPTLETPISELKESLRCILHTLIFNRAMGGARPIEPLTIHSPLFNLAYVKVRDDSGDLDAAVEDRIRAFADAIASSPGSYVLSLSFFTEKAKERNLLWQVISGSTVSKEKLFFEKWRIPVSLLSSRPNSPVAGSPGGPADAAATAAPSVKQILWFLVRKLSEKTEHLPATCATTVYPFEIAFDKVPRLDLASGSASSGTGWSPRSIASSIKSIPYIT